MNDRNPTPERDDIATLLQAAGKRTPVPDEVTHRVKATAREAWRETVRPRTRRTIGWRFALAAAALLVAVVMTGRWLAPDGGSSVASSFVLEASVGDVRFVDEAAPEGAAGSRLEPGRSLRRGGVVVTGPDGLVALRAAAGHSVRIDGGSRVAVPADGPLRLERGAIYVDSGSDTPSRTGLLLQVPQGLVEEIGTQYEVRLVDGALRIRTREGLVRLHARDGSHPVEAGRELSVSPDGTVHTGPGPVHGPAWGWVLAAMPAPDLEGRTAAEFLRGYAREIGLTLAYDRAETARTADEAILSGVPGGLPAARLLDAVLPTCGLAYRVEGGVLVVTREP